MNQLEAARRTLRTTFGYDAFRPGQEEIIQAILSGEDVMAVMPTGAGKSLCYQIPALMLPGVTLVVSPLISLMRDQVTSLIQNGVRAAYLNSSLTQSQFYLALRNAKQGVYRIIYVAPERLMTDAFQAFAQQTAIAQVVVDEAHCVSQWGQDFRPGYLKIEPFIRSLPSRPRVSAFTATATQTVREDVVRLLGLHAPHQVVTGFDRPNLFFEVRRERDRDAAMLRFLREHQGQSGIVYCGTRKSVEEVAARLREEGIPATGYHAGMSDEERSEAQEAFVSDSVPVIVATNAFGMGIDKSNVGFVLHYQMPKDLESYYQEAGRAGRDGEEAVCCLLYQPSDVRLNTFLIEHAQETSEMDAETKRIVLERAQERLRRMTYYATGSTCLRSRILQYFGETPPEGGCGNCSVCLSAARERDVTREAGLAVAGVMALGGRYGLSTTAKVLCGATDARIRERGLNRLSAYGCLKAEGEDNVRALLEELVMDEALELTKGQYPLLREGPRAREVLRGDEPVRLRIEAPTRIRVARREQTPAQRGLLERLIALRRKFAQAQHVPPFIIFANATLREMAERRPRTRAAMLRVSGVSEGKMRRYGDAFLDAIRQYEEEEEIVHF